MRLKTFLAFVSPSLFAMIALIAIPLIGVVYLSFQNTYTQTEIVEVTSTVPMFGGLTRTKVDKIPQPVLDENGNPVKVWEFVGGKNYSSVAAPGELADAFTKERSVDGQEAPFGRKLQGIYRDVTDIDFWAALEFTLLYAFVTTPLVLGIGFFVALGVNSLVQWLRGPVIFASLLPFIITPVVGSLSIYWLFLDNAVISALLQQLFDTKVYFLKDAFTIRSLIILFGVWHVTPFAFIILYAGLQTVSTDALQAAEVDGANFRQRIWYVVIPHLKPLFVFITMIHLMDAYRIFEPVLVFGSNLFANSLQYLTYHILNFEDNYTKAAASAILTVIGIAVLMVPFLRRTYKEQKGEL